MAAKSAFASEAEATISRFATGPLIGIGGVGIVGDVGVVDLVGVVDVVDVVGFFVVGGAGGVDIGVVVAVVVRTGDARGSCNCCGTSSVVALCGVCFFGKNSLQLQRAFVALRWRRPQPQ